MTTITHETLSSAEWAARAPVLRDEGWILLDLHGVDRLGLTEEDERGRFEIVCQLLKRADKSRMTVHVAAEGNPPAIASVTRVWGTAGFAERETYDMYGIVFEGHDDLSRILMPDEWEGYPLRKDYDVGKIAIDFKPQPFLQIETPGQAPTIGESEVGTDELGQIKQDDADE
ncbi:MAG: NADH-quinone oxidoreductase subunit C [Actinobacteria bacterium]|nr:NADH-quinone oxidoreductase subunit C [Actinomycetota bacterium]